MALVNEYYLRLPGSYLFADIAKRVQAFKVSHPKQRVISLGIGDVTRPLAPAVVEAMHKAADEMAHKETFRGYGPEHGYDFLREAILKGDFLTRGIHLDKDEIFVNDGAKSDTANIQELLRWDNSVALTDPVYPVYVDYLCYPNNPTGTVLTKDELKKWVNFALRNEAIIFYDAAYQAYIQDPEIPHSIYEIKGARKCAIEFHSYSKTAGFTGVRCGYTVIPKDVVAKTIEGQEVQLNALWERRQSTKFNGTSYISQRAAEATYSPEGHKQTRETIAYYMENARIMRETLTQLGYAVYGGENAPYLWVKTPNDTDSWKFFDTLLYGCGLVCTPGVGFGPSGEGYFRLTSFGNREDVEEAMERFKGL